MNCIGENNYKEFYLFLIFIFYTFVVLDLLFIMRIYVELSPKRKVEDILKSIRCGSGMIIVCVLYTFFTGSYIFFLIQSLYYIIINDTSLIHF